MSRTMRRWITLQLLLALALSTLTGCGRMPAASLPAEGHSSPAETRVDPVQLRDTIDQLAGPAQLGRLAGSEAGAAVADWIAGRFGALGLTPKGDDGFKQPFTFSMTRFLWPTSLALTGIAQTRPYRYRTDFRIDPASGAGTISAPVIYLGYGLTGPSRDDYRGADVRGKAVMIVRDCPANIPATEAAVRARVTAAAQRGAAAVLLIDRADHIDWSAGVHPVAASMPVLGVSPTVAGDLFTASKYDLGNVLAQTEKGPVTPEPLSGKVEITVTEQNETNVRGTNIIGFLPGTDTSAGYYIVSAHFDHLGSDIDGEYYPGVADNASGVAVMLETARVLSIDRPRAGVLFVGFDAEEEGLIGSNHLASHLPIAAEALLGVINIDTIGASGVWRIRHDAGAEQLATTLSEQAARLGADVDLMAATGGSDEHSFALRGLPALCLLDRVGPQAMHSVNEPASTVSDDHLVTATQAVVATIHAGQTTAGEPAGAAGAASQTATAAAPTAPVVFQPSGAVAGSDGWMTLRTPHYTVKYRQDTKVIGDPADQAEQIYNLLATSLGSEPAVPLTLVLTSGREAHEAAVRSVYPDAANPITDAWVHYPSRTIVINIAGLDRTELAQAIGHETAHLFAAGAMRRITQTPWAREYLATYLERRVAGARFGLSGWDSKDGYTTLLGQIKPQPWSAIAADATANAADACVEASSVYYFLEQQYGQAKLTEYWQRLLSEGDPEKAFKAVYRKTSFQLETEWRAFYGLK